MNGEKFGVCTLGIDSHNEFKFIMCKLRTDGDVENNSMCFMTDMFYYLFSFKTTAAVAQWARAFASQTEGLVFESQPLQTEVIKPGCDSSTAKRSATGVSVTGPRR